MGAGDVPCGCGIMRLISLEEFIRKSKEDIDRFILNQWIFNPIIRLVCAQDVKKDKVIAVEKGIKKIIDDVGTMHTIQYGNINGIFDMIYSQCPPGQPFDTRILVQNLFHHVADESEIGYHLEIERKYANPGPIVVVTNNNKALTCRAGTSTYLGLVQLPVKNIDVNETQLIASHEAGHLLTLLPGHHDTLSSFGNEDAHYKISGVNEGPCVMNSRPEEKDNYLCLRCITVAREKWKEIENRTGMKILNKCYEEPPIRCEHCDS